MINLCICSTLILNLQEFRWTEIISLTYKNLENAKLVSLYYASLFKIRNLLFFEILSKCFHLKTTEWIPVPALTPIQNNTRSIFGLIPF